MLASSPQLSATRDFDDQDKDRDTNTMECESSSPIDSASPKSASGDERCNLTSASPPHDDPTATRDDSGETASCALDSAASVEGTMSSKTTLSAATGGDATADSPKSSADMSQRTSFDLGSLFSNNNKPPPPFDLSLPFGDAVATAAGPPAAAATAAAAFAPALGNGFSFFGLGHAAFLHLSQVLSASNTDSLPSTRPSLNNSHLRPQLTHTPTATRQPPPYASSVSSGSSVGVASRATRSTDSDRKRNYPYTFQHCVLCKKNVHSSKLPCHIRQCHITKPMFRCPSCEFTSTYSKNNVKSHMVSLHGLATEPISFMDHYAAQVEEYMKKCFPNVRGRGRPVHGASPRSLKGVASPKLPGGATAATVRTPTRSSSRRSGIDEPPSSDGTPAGGSNKNMEHRFALPPPPPLPPKCVCRCQCGRYPVDLLIVDRVIAELINEGRLPPHPAVTAVDTIDDDASSAPICPTFI